MFCQTEDLFTMFSIDKGIHKVLDIDLCTLCTCDLELWEI